MKKPIQVSARKYMDLLFDYIEDQISNPAIFPSNDDDSYPPEFIEVVKTIFKRIFRMYGHIYCKSSTFFVESCANMLPCFAQTLTSTRYVKVVPRSSSIRPFNTLHSSFANSDW